MRGDKNTEWVLTLEFKALPNHAELFKSMCFHSAQALENTNGITAIGVVELKTAEECRARDSDANIAIQQGSVPDPTALESIFVTVKKNCHICDFANVDSPVGPCLKCAQDTMSGFKLSSTLTERPGR